MSLADPSEGIGDLRLVEAVRIPGLLEVKRDEHANWSIKIKQNRSAARNAPFRNPPRTGQFDRFIVKSRGIGSSALRLPETQVTVWTDRPLLLATWRLVHVIGRSTFPRSDHRMARRRRAGAKRSVAADLRTVAWRAIWLTADSTKAGRDRLAVTVTAGIIRDRRHIGIYVVMYSSS
jgi:hypothetical protein